MKKGETKNKLFEVSVFSIYYSRELYSIFELLLKELDHHFHRIKLKANAEYSASKLKRITFYTATVYLVE